MDLQVKFEAKLKAGIKWDQAANVFVTFAPALGLYSQGTTKLQAKAALNDAVNSVLFVSYKKNVLHALMTACGAREDQRPLNELRMSGDQYVRVEEQVLEQHKYEDVFEIQAELALAA